MASRRENSGSLVETRRKAADYRLRVSYSRGLIMLRPNRRSNVFMGIVRLLLYCPHLPSILLTFWCPMANALGTNRESTATHRALHCCKGERRWKTGYPADTSLPTVRALSPSFGLLSALLGESRSFILESSFVRASLLRRNGASGGKTNSKDYRSTHLGKTTPTSPCRQNLFSFNY